MSKNYKVTVTTRCLSREELDSCLEEIITILKRNDVTEVELLFGVFWGNDYKNWTPFVVSIDEIKPEIENAERSGAGSFYNDDTWFTFPLLDMEILSCHEYDLHLDYNEPNKVVDDILDAWNARQIVHITRQNQLPG